MFPFTCPFMAVLADADLPKASAKKASANGVSVFLSGLADILLETVMKWHNITII